MALIETGMAEGRRTAITPTPGLASLAAAVTDACEGPAIAMGERIVVSLRTAAADPGLLTASQRHPRDGGYARHLLYADPKGRFSILSLVWGGGQFSPAHAHYTWCAYAVQSGELVETAYEFDRRLGRAHMSSTAKRRAGEGCFSHAGLEDIHRLGNSEATAAVSIHVYGVDGARVATHVNRIVDIDFQEGAA
ncbi:MAG TPA: cysteine dioxygenase family protein [Stellaceae bacterium]|nr:cysteine dioxygenase family protein [Stellaceae bacterium]